MKITFLGAGSTVFAKNLLGDCMLTPALQSCEIALYDIDAKRLEESCAVINALNKNINQNRASVKTYLGAENRKDALRSADFVVNAIQVGGYEPCTVTDFEIPKKFGLRQTIGDTLGIGGIMRALRTIPVMEDFARDIEEVCPDAWFLNYTNPMSILTGYMQRYTGVKTVGLCHSWQACSHTLLKCLDMLEKADGRRDMIAGINHMAWLLKIEDQDGHDLYPEIKKRAKEKNQTEKHWDMVRYDYMEKLGYYCTESSEHNAEYSPFYIKSKYPELIDRYNIPLDEYPRRCTEQIEKWKKQRDGLVNNSELAHEKTHEYAAYILEALSTGKGYVNDKPIVIGGNVLNTGGLIENLPHDACVEVPCVVNCSGIHPVRVGKLPVQLAAMNQCHINVHLLTIEAAYTLKKEHIYHAAMLDPHTAAELSVDDIRLMVDELIDAHGNWLPKYV